MNKDAQPIRDRGDGFTSAIIGGCVVALLAIVGLVILVGGEWSDTNATEMTCVYNGGPLDSKGYRNYEEPGAGRNYEGFASSSVYVPVRLVQYRVSLDPTQGDTPTPDKVTVRVKGYSMDFEPTVTFTINTQVIDGKPVACDLVESQLKPFNATDFNTQGGNWQFKFLNERWRPVLNDVMTRVLQRGYDPGELKFNTGGARDRAADEVGKDIKAALRRSFGVDYFCDSDYKFSQDAASCGDSLTVILPEPKLSAEDESQLSKPQRAKIAADNDIAAANEAARKAQEVADAKQKEADSAKTLADANEEIAKQNARVVTANASNDYAWCAYIVTLGQNCALVKAAEQGDYPDVITGGDTSIAIPVTTPTTTPPAP